MKIVFFDKKIEGFVYSLEKSTIAKVLRTIDLLERFGNNLGMPHSRRVFKDLFELRVRGMQEIRLLYVFRAPGAVIIHGFVKKSRRSPINEINVAKNKLRQLDIL